MSANVDEILSQEAPQKQANGRAYHAPADHSHVVKRAVAYISKMPPAIDKQGGHNATFEVAATLGRGFALDEDTVLGILREHYNPRCEGPWSELELRHKAAQGVKADRPLGYLLDDDREWSPRTAYRAHTAPMDDMPPWEAYESGPIPEGEPVGEDAEDTEATPTTGPLVARVLRLDDEWLTVAPPPRKWLLERPDPDTDGATRRGVLARGKVGMFAGGGGVGKTMAAVQLAIAVATGRDWYGLTVATPGRVLLGLAEEDAEEIRRRLYYTALALGLDDTGRALARDRIVCLPLAGVPVALLESDAAGNPVETVTAHDLRHVLAGEDGWALVILDPLARWAGLDAETDNAQATRFIECVESYTTAPGAPTVLLTHHTTKLSRREGDGAATAARGASALVDGARWVATLTPAKLGEADIARLEVVKSNYSALGAPVDLMREDDGTMRPLGTMERQAAEAVAKGARLREVEAKIMEAVSTGHYTSESALRSAVGAKMTIVQTALAGLKAAGRLAKQGRDAPFQVVEGHRE
jgi:hypothetical protein